VAVEQDHLERLIRRPLGGLNELLWNAVDADASEITADLALNGWGGTEAVEVRDDGTGISREQADLYFGRLGGSWKKMATTTEAGRALHGQAGQGRWAAYGLGEVVHWTSVARQATGNVAEIRITGRRISMKAFDVDGPFPVGGPTGTSVRVEQLNEAAIKALERDDVVGQLTTTFALILEQYPLVIRWRGRPLDPASIQSRRYEAALRVDGVDEPVQLVVIEWAQPQKNRLLHLCDHGGASLQAVRAGIHAPGFDFTAYLRWEGFRERTADVALADFGVEPFSSLIEAAKSELRRYFGQRAQERGRELVTAWKADQSYPYSTPPQNPVEAAERQVFDIAAVATAPVLENIEPRSRKLSLRLLREALESNPGSLHTVLHEVLELPQDQVDELRDLLDKTSLSSVIAAARQITDRLDFLLGLEEMVFGDMRKRLLERSQLHRVLAGETWVFREDYALTADDVTLRTALRDHIGLLGREDLATEDVEAREVLDPTGARVVVDLMLSRIVPQAHNHREHLVIEVKRPTVHVGLEQLLQIQTYALAVAKDGRFAMTDTRWEFWIVGDQLASTTDLLLKQGDREPGVFVVPGAEHNVTIRAVTWAHVLQDARHRLGFVRDSLAYTSTTDASMSYLRRVHGKYLPSSAAESEAADAAPDTPEAAAS